MHDLLGHPVSLADLLRLTSVLTYFPLLFSRELSHKIKGVSMTSFSADDVEAMMSGGNARCNAHFLGRYNGDVPLPTGT